MCNYCQAVGISGSAVLSIDITSVLPARHPIQIVSLRTNPLGIMQPSAPTLNTTRPIRPGTAANVPTCVRIPEPYVPGVINSLRFLAHRQIPTQSF